MSHPIFDAWKTFNSTSPIPLVPISSETEYDRMLEFLHALMDSYGGDHHSPEGALLHIVGSLVLEWEQQNALLDLSSVTPAGVLRHLMEAQDLTQRDVEQGSGIPQSVLSLLLSGKREINADHARALARFFRVGPGVFL